MKSLSVRVLGVTVLMAGWFSAAAGQQSAPQQCWTDVTTHGGCSSGDWHSLQFRNKCSGPERTVNVCVKWTSGRSSGVVNRLAASAAGGKVAEIKPGLCANGNISYNYRSDGDVPKCP